MHRLVNTIRQIARHEVEQHCPASLGVVQSVQETNGSGTYSCTVQLRDSGIVLPRVPIATSLIGAASLPREKDLVLVVFGEADFHEPIVAGRLYSEDVAPPSNHQGETVLILPGDEQSTDQRLEFRIKTPGDGTRNIHLVLDGTPKIELEIDDQSIRLQAQDASLTLSQSGASDGQAVLKVGDSNVTIKESGDVSVEATGTLTLKASKIEISGDTSIKIAGTEIDLN